MSEHQYPLQSLNVTAVHILSAEINLNRGEMCDYTQQTL